MPQTKNRTDAAAQAMARRQTKRRAAARRRRHRRIMLLTLGCCLVLAVSFRVGASFADAVAGHFDNLAGDSAFPPPVSAQHENGAPPYVIAVDAGHGGGDSGAIGVIPEYEMTTRTAEDLKALLAQDANYTPVMTRDSYDTAAKPSERVAAANAQDADLLLSIHGNSAPDGTTSGFECYPITPGRTEHDRSVQFAQYLANEMQALGQKLRGYQGLRYAYYDENDNKTLVDASDETVRTDTTFTILERAACPAVLAEQCFVTSEADVTAYGSEDGCRAAAQAYYRAICTYFGTVPTA